MEKTDEEASLIGALTLVSSVAIAQPSQSQGGAQAGTNGTADTANTGMPAARRDNGTTGISSGLPGSNDNEPVETTGPAGQMSKPSTTK